MVDDRSNYCEHKSHLGATGSPRLVRFRHFCVLDETRRKGNTKNDPARQIMSHIDALTKKVGKGRNPRIRDSALAQQNRALAYLALHLSTSKPGK